LKKSAHFWIVSRAICWCTGPVTEKIRAIRFAAFASLAAHVALGWWVLHSNPSARGTVDPPVTASERLVVQFILPLRDKTPAAGALSEPVVQPSVNGRQSRRAPKVLNLETTPRVQGQGQQPASALQTFNEAQAMTPAAPSQGPALLNLDLSRAAKSAELQRRKTGLSGAVDAMQKEISQTPETRAFTKLAPVASGIVSETIMADGSRLIKFSAGGCMRVVNPSSRSPDDTRKSVMENC
jgi:hypothetical protein